LKDDRWTPNRSYWVFRGQAPKNPPLQGDHQADLVVIGGGVTGLSTAIHAQIRFPRLRVILVEAHHAGYGATGRSGGFIETGTEMGEREGTEDNVELVTDLLDRFEISCAWDPEAWHLDPYRFAVGLKRAAESVGVLVYEDTRIQTVEKEQQAKLLGDGFTLQAPRVVAAANGYLPKLGIAERLIFPVHTTAAVTPPLPEDLLDTIPENIYIMTSKEMYIWGRKMPNRRLLVGSGAEYFYDNGLYFRGESPVFNALHRFMVKEYPKLEDYPFEYAWSGPMGATTDQEPIIGTDGVDGNILYCAGYTGIGLAMGVKAGLILAGMLDGVDPPSWLQREVLGLPGEPFRYIGVNMFINLMNLSLYSMPKH
jgi:glycine/D-amino acid oxidase-like deaminating enzyme